MASASPPESIIPNLLEYAYARARASADAHELRVVAEGAEVNYHWLSKFAIGTIPGASYEKIHRLAVYYFERERRAAEEAGQPVPAWPLAARAQPASPAS